MNLTNETQYDAWLVKIETARILHETDTKLPFVRIMINTFIEEERGPRKVTFYMPKGPDRPVVDQICKAFGVEKLIELKGKWATMICPSERCNILGLKPLGGHKPIMVTSRKEAWRQMRVRENW